MFVNVRPNRLPLMAASLLAASVLLASAGLRVVPSGHGAPGGAANWATASLGSAAACGCACAASCGPVCCCEPSEGEPMQGFAIDALLPGLRLRPASCHGQPDDESTGRRIIVWAPIAPVDGLFNVGPMTQTAFHPSAPPTARPAPDTPPPRSA